MHPYRSHNCSELGLGHVGEKVRTSGWVNRIRDHGGVLFIDLRDHYGVTQIVADPESEAFPVLEKVRAEWVIKVDGIVKKRDEDLINKSLSTGEIEVYSNSVEILSEADELPLPVFGELEYPEETRLKYRFLDLRREKLHKNIMMRSQIISKIRQLMVENGFNEFQTPILTASSPEGARDFLVPSRLNLGKFYALPQAPQQFKQLIMVAGFDRYFQIAPCFRDEDPRADRSPGEFYQLDVEMSFVTQEDIFSVMEPVIRDLFKEFANGSSVTDHFPRIKYKDALLWYGSDKPDLRNPIKMQNVSEIFRDSDFSLFSKLLEQENTEIRAIPAPGGGSRAFCDRMNAFAQKQGLPGMGYIFWRVESDKIEGVGPIAKNIGQKKTEELRSRLNLGEGDAAFFLGGQPKKFEPTAAKARDEIGDQLNLTKSDTFEFCWIVDFPLYELDSETNEIQFSHNPFSMPQGGLEALNQKDPLEILGYQYDIVCNGVELSSGAIRNHKPEIMYKAFEIIGKTKEYVDKNFGGMIDAFKYGAPPHGGIAPGIDRIVMLLANAQNIREVILFPMNQGAEDLMMGAPSKISNDQLSEIGLRVLKRE